MLRAPHDAEPKRAQLSGLLAARFKKTTRGRRGLIRCYCSGLEVFLERFHSIGIQAVLYKPGSAVSVCLTSALQKPTDVLRLERCPPEIFFHAICRNEVHKPQKKRKKIRPVPSGRFMRLCRTPSRHLVRNPMPQYTAWRSHSSKNTEHSKRKTLRRKIRSRSCAGVPRVVASYLRAVYASVVVVGTQKSFKASRCTQAVDRI